MVPRSGFAAVTAWVRRVGSVGPTVAQRLGGTGGSLVLLRRGRGGFGVAKLSFVRTAAAMASTITGSATEEGEVVETEPLKL